MHAEESRRTSLSPMLSVRRGAEAILFYQAAFGAQVLYRLDGEQGSVVARFSVHEAEFWIADESPENQNYSPETLGGATARLVLVVDDPQAVVAQAIAAGAALVWPVADQHGWRLGRIRDPYGHHWEIGHELAAH